MANNSDGYVVPLGLDISPALKAFDDLKSGAQELKSASAEAGKSMEDSFKKPEQEAQKLEKELGKVTDKVNEVSQAAKGAGADVAKGLDVSGVVKTFGQNINSLKKQINDITAAKKLKLEIDPQAITDLTAARDALSNNFDQVKDVLREAGDSLRQNLNAARSNVESITKDIDRINNSDVNQRIMATPGQQQQELRKELFAAQDLLKQEQAILDNLQSQLSEIDNVNKDLASTLSSANVAIDANKVKLVDLNSSFDEVYGDLQPLTTRLGELEDRMYELALAGQTNTDEFKQLQAEAIKYRQTIQQVDAAVDTFAKRSAILDITIEAAQGLTGAFAAVQGAAALFGEENEEVEKALLKVNAAMSILQGIQAVAAVLNKDSAISALLLRNNLIGQAQATTAATTATTAQTVATRAATVASRAFSVALKALGIGLVIGLIAFLVENWDKLTAAVNKFLPAGASVGKLFDSIKSYAMGVGNAIIQYLITPFSAITALLNGNLDEFKQAIRNGFSFKANFQKGFNDQEIRNERAHQIALEKTRIEADARDLVRRKNRGENVEKEEIALQKRRLAIVEAGGKEEKEAREALEDLQDAAYKNASDKAKEAAKKAADDAKKAAEERKERDKRNNAAILAYTRAFEDSQLSIMKDGAAKQRAQVDLNYARMIEDLKKETDLSVQAINERNRLIQQLEAQRFVELVNITTANVKQMFDLQVEAQKQRLELSKVNRTNDLALLQAETNEQLLAIRDKYKDTSALRIELEQAVADNAARERRRINLEYDKKDLEEAEAKEVALLEIGGEYATRNEKTERRKQIALLNIKLEYAKKALEAVITSGEAEDSVAVLQAKETIAKIQKEVTDAIKDNDNADFNWLDFLGLGDLGDEEQQAIKRAFAAMMESVGQITDFIVGQYDRQIEAKQAVIDQLDKEISDAEKRVEDEKKLAEKGLANNLEAAQAELASKEEQKNEEIRQQEELVAKKQELQRAQLILDTAIQASNLAVAATEIFKSLAGIPFIGIPLAIAAVGTMIGAFALSRVKAAQAINTQSFGDGGWIDGKSHRNGGVKYVSADGSGGVVELEGKEHVTNVRSAAKYADVLDAINADNFGGLSEHNAAVKAMLDGMGISLFSEVQKTAVKDSLNVTNQNIYVSSSGRELDELERIAQILAMMADKQNKDVSSWQDDNFYYTKKGNKTTRTRKNKQEVSDAE